MTRDDVRRELDILAHRDIPVLGAKAAYIAVNNHMTPNDELADVLCALDDWVEAGRPRRATPGGREPYALLVSACTKFYYNRRTALGMDPEPRTLLR